MQNLKNSSLTLLLIFFLSSCHTTKVFNLETFPATPESHLDDRHVVTVNSNRVHQKCLFYNAEGDNNWRHQYMIYILNDKNETLEIMQPTNQDKEHCYSQLHRIERILSTEPQVKICIRDKLKKTPQDPKEQEEMIEFGELGKHKIAYDSLTLDSICNSKECHSNNDIWVNTCPGFVKHDSLD